MNLPDEHAVRPDVAPLGVEGLALDRLGRHPSGGRVTVDLVERIR